MATSRSEGCNPMGGEENRTIAFADWQGNRSVLGHGKPMAKTGRGKIGD
jgi:hypothetical protein